MHDDENDYTKDWIEEQMGRHFYDITKKYNLEYFDIYNNRNEIFSNRQL